ncbi:MAG: SDR family oxidoreductase [Verrucomicrobia bacterium]|nr:SDR family oxidoreductase [Verrucomicrobiota bacterium]
MEKKAASELVLITGGARGLGLAIVQELLSVGYRVATCSRRSTEAIQNLQQQYPNHFNFAALDITDSSAAADWVHQINQSSGPLYGVIHNAAIAQDGLLATLPEVEIDRMLDVDLRAVLKLNRLAIRNLLKTNRGGRIISISSIIAHRGYTGLAVYAAAKAGLEGMTRSLARELGPRGITVNCIAPGYMLSEMSAGLDDKQLQQIVRRTPLGRLATFADVVPAVKFLLSPDAAFITGQSLVIDGGITV